MITLCFPIEAPETFELWSNLNWPSADVIAFDARLLPFSPTDSGYNVTFTLLSDVPLSVIMPVTSPRSGIGSPPFTALTESPQIKSRKMELVSEN